MILEPFLARSMFMSTLDALHREKLRGAPRLDVDAMIDSCNAALWELELAVAFGQRAATYQEALRLATDQAVVMHAELHAMFGREYGREVTL